MSTLDQGVLLKGQAEWIADPSPLKVMEKGRRTGVTWAEAADDVIIAATARSEGGQNVFYFPQAKEDAVEYIDTCAKWAKGLDHATSAMEEGTWAQDCGYVLKKKDPDRNIQTYKITFASGNRIVALSSAPARARGKQGVFVLDEAAFHPNLPGVLKAVMATILRGGKVRVISTHDGENNPFNELVNEIRAGRRKGKVHRYELSKAVGDGMYARMCEMADKPWSAEKEKDWLKDVYDFYGEDASEELDAIPATGSGSFLSGVLIESRMRPGVVLKYECTKEFATKSNADRQSECQAWIDDHLAPLLALLDPALEHGHGMDFGRSGDLSVIAPWERGRDLVVRIPFLVEMRNVPFDQQEQMLFYIIDRLPRYTKGANDARGNGQSVAEHAWQKYGLDRVIPVMLTVEWYRDNNPSFKAAFEDGDIEIPKDADVRSDLRAIKMDKGVAKVPDNLRAKGTDGKPRHADSAIAIWLAHFSSRQDAVAIEFESSGRPASSFDMAGGRNDADFAGDSIDLGGFIHGR